MPAVSGMFPDQKLGRPMACLREFAPGSQGFARMGRGVRTRFEQDDLPVPSLVRLALRLLGCHDLGRAEKLAWEMPFEFRGVACSIALEKFGLRLYVEPSPGADSATLATDIVRNLQKAIGSLERAVLKDLATQQMALGNVTIANQYPSLNNMYRFFREAAAALYGEEERPLVADSTFSEIFADFTQYMGRQQRAFYNTVAMIQAYYSRLEHTLVLLLPFSGYDPAAESLKDFIGDIWRKKFVRIFGLFDPASKRFHDRLCEVSEDYRNTYSHGGFDKGGAALHFQIPHIGLVPAALSDIRDKPHFRFVPIERENFQQVCDLFDKLDEWMRSSASWFGMQWVEGGLDLRFDQDFLDELRRAMASHEEFDIFTAQHGCNQDRASNMDW